MLENNVVLGCTPKNPNKNRNKQTSSTSTSCVLRNSCSVDVNFRINVLMCALDYNISLFFIYFYLSHTYSHTHTHTPQWCWLGHWGSHEVCDVCSRVQFPYESPSGGRRWQAGKTGPLTWQQRVFERVPGDPAASQIICVNPHIMLNSSTHYLSVCFICCFSWCPKFRRIQSYLYQTASHLFFCL